jgi:TPR repeat protein
MRLFQRWVRKAIIGAILTGFGATAAMAKDRSVEQNVLTCQIDGQERQASVSIVGSDAVYRYGRRGENPELTLTVLLMDVGYQRKNGPGATIDEIITFANADTNYRIAAGFRDGVEPDPSAYIPFGTLTVSRAGKDLARLNCRPDTIERVHDRLLANMREIGRERSSDGEIFPNYDIEYPLPARQSAACQADNNVDTCWGRGVGAERGGDLRGALEHYDMSCDARLITAGCYEAGKLYLQKRQLRNYTRAKERFSRVCSGQDSGQGPYACKFLGWMYLTGVGVERDRDIARGFLAKACFLQNEDLLIDPEGCHFLARSIFETRDEIFLTGGDVKYTAYLALAMACTDNAKTVCDEARALYQRETARGASWIKDCDAKAARHGPIESCVKLATIEENYDAAQAMRRQMRDLFVSAQSP